MHFSESEAKCLNIRDVLFDVLCRWRGIIVVALIAAVMAGELRYIINIRRIKMAKNSNNQAELLDVVEAKIAVDESKEVLNQLQSYVDESIWIGFNSQKEAVSVKQYSIISDQVSLAVEQVEKETNIEEESQPDSIRVCLF